MSQMLLLALFATNVPATIPSDPLEPALADRMQCYAPNEQKRTCRSLASYTRIAGAKYANTALVLISDVGPATLETTTTVEVKARAVCGAIRSEDIARGKLVVAGRLLPADEAAPILSRIVQSMAPLIGKQICTRYEPAAGGLVAKVSIDGVYRADSDQRVRWVSSSEGYSVAP